MEADFPQIEMNANFNLIFLKNDILETISRLRVPLKKLKISKQLAASRRSYSTKIKGKCVSLTRILFLKKFKSNSVCLHFPPKRVLKKIKKLFLFNMTSR